MTVPDIDTLAATVREALRWVRATGLEHALKDYGKADTALAALAKHARAEHDRADRYEKALQRAPAMILTVEEYERWYIEDCYPALAGEDA